MNDQAVVGGRGEVWWEDLRWSRAERDTEGHPGGFEGPADTQA